MTLCYGAVSSELVRATCFTNLSGSTNSSGLSVQQICLLWTTFDLDKDKWKLQHGDQ